MEKAYFERIADRRVAEELEAIGAVLIEGAKWCGKTSTAERLAKSALYMDDPKMRQVNLMRAETEPASLLEGDAPRLIDEWQIAANQIWNAIRAEVDRRNAFGQFILTGSSTPVRLERDAHSGTGRIKRIRMRPMSLYESRDSSGVVSLASLFKSKGKRKMQIRGESDLRLNDLAFLLCRGGLPTAVTAKKRSVALKQADNYYNAVVHQEFRDDNGRAIAPERIAAILRSYARHVGAQASLATIHADCVEHAGAAISPDTVANYIHELNRLFVFEDMTAWNPNLRSKTAIRTAVTRYFTDPSIAAAALGVGPDALAADPETFGLFFENLAVRDLRVYAEAIDGRLYHYRDKNGLECDAVLTLRDGRYGLFEMKLGGDTLIEEGAKTLNKFADRIDVKKMGAPVFKIVLCGVCPAAYRRTDDVVVVPIDCLGP